MTIRTTVRNGITPVLRQVRGIVREPYGGKRGELIRASAQRTFANQFARGGNFGASGGFISWLPTQPFGTKPATRPPLGGASGSLARAAQGGAGGAWATSAKRVTLSIALIYWFVHDQGARIGITDRMRGKVAATFGVFFRAAKTHIVIPARRLIDTRAPQWGKLAREVVVSDIRRAVG